MSEIAVRSTRPSRTRGFALMLPRLAIVKFRVVCCRYDEGLQYRPGEPPKVAGPLHHGRFPANRKPGMSLATVGRVVHRVPSLKRWLPESRAAGVR